jgi:hypothetical protein
LISYQESNADPNQNRASLRWTGEPADTLTDVAFGGKADITRTRADVRRPKADMVGARWMQRTAQFSIENVIFFSYRRHRAGLDLVLL